MLLEIHVFIFNNIYPVHVCGYLIEITVSAHAGKVIHSQCYYVINENKTYQHRRVYG